MSPVLRALPSKRGFGTGLLLTLPLLVVGVAAEILGGWTALLGVVIGAVVSAQSAVTGTTLLTRCTIAVTTAAGVIIGGLLAPFPLLLIVVVLLAALLPALWSLRSVGIGALLPIAPVLGAATPDAVPFTLGAWALLGGAATIVAALVFRVSIPARPLPQRMVWFQSGVAAVALAIGIGVAAFLRIEGGEWLALVIVGILRPDADLGAGRGLTRAVGVPAALIVALVATLFVPRPVALVLAVVCIIGAFAWELAGDTITHVALLMPVLIVAALPPAQWGDMASALTQGIFLVTGGTIAETVVAASVPFARRRV